MYQQYIYYKGSLRFSSPTVSIYILIYVCMYYMHVVCAALLHTYISIQQQMVGMYSSVIQKVQSVLACSAPALKPPFDGVSARFERLSYTANLSYISFILYFKKYMKTFFLLILQIYKKNREIDLRDQGSEAGHSWQKYVKLHSDQKIPRFQSLSYNRQFKNLVKSRLEKTEQDFSCFSFRDVSCRAK